jgi:hypothetical protein
LIPSSSSWRASLRASLVGLLPDGTFVATTDGHWTAGEPPYIVRVRFTLGELDARLPRR